MGFPGGVSGKEPASNEGDVRDVGLIPQLGSSPGGGHGNPLQQSCLENPMDGGAWQAAIYRVAESQTRLDDLAHMRDTFTPQSKVEFPF